MDNADGKVIIKTVLDNSDFDKDLAKLETKGGKISSILQKGLKASLNAGKGLLTTMTSVIKTLATVGTKIAGLGILLGGLSVGIGLIGLGFKKAFESEQIKANLDYIKFAITKALEPAANKIAEIVAKIVHLLFVAMQYIAYIIKAWTGVNIFENAGIDAYASSLKKAEKNAKDLNKQLAGFDKINKLEDKSASGGGASGGAMPDFDLSSMENVEIPKWIQWIADNKDIVVTAILAIAAAFITLQLGFGGVIALIVAAIVALVALIVKNWDKIKEVLGKVGSWIYENIIKPVGDFFVALWEKIKQIFGPVIQFFVNIFTTIWNNITTIISNIIQIVGFVWNKIIGILSPIASWIYNNIIKPVINFFTTAWNFIIDKINKIIGLAKDIGTKVADVIGGAFKKVINAVLGAIESILNFPIRSINKLIDVINKVPGINLGTLQTFKLPRLAKGGIVNMPGRGVDYYGANIAERGPEAVIPMTNQQSLETIGRTIAKYTKFDANVTLELEGRILARVMQEINSDRNFARNGG